MILGLSVDNLLLALTMLGGIAVCIYEGGEIKASLEGNIHEEHTIREAEMSAVSSQVADLKKSVEETHQDIRELRSYIVVDARYPPKTR